MARGSRLMAGGPAQARGRGGAWTQLRDTAYFAELINIGFAGNAWNLQKLSAPPECSEQYSESMLLEASLPGLQQTLRSLKIHDLLNFIVRDSTLIFRAA